MAEQSEISWTDATFNPWMGCTKISPACDNCYAERDLDHRYGKVRWGAGNPRVRTGEKNWNLPLRWNIDPFYECTSCGWRGAKPDMVFPGSVMEKCASCPTCDSIHLTYARRRVFCASLADVFDNEVDPAWRSDLFKLIDATTNLDWLLLTKRIGNVKKLTGGVSAWPNVWLGAMVVNQEEADRDIPKLLATPARIRFLSIEPILGPITLDYTWLRQPNDDWPRQGNGNTISWVICGGESGHHARPMHPQWARDLRDQCAAAGVPFHFKQWGEWLPAEKLHDPVEWMLRLGGSLRCWQWDDSQSMRVGKKAAGRQLDGRTHDGFPV